MNSMIKQGFLNYRASYIALFGTLGSVILLIISILLYISVDPNFSIFTQYISDIGVGAGGSRYVFTICLVFASIILTFIQFSVAKVLNIKGGNKYFIWIAFLVGLVSSFGLFLAGIFPYDLSMEGHSIGARIFFIGGFIFVILYGLIEFLTPDVPKIQALINFVFAFFFALFVALAFFVSTVVSISGEIIKFTEWLVLFAIVAWGFEHGIYLNILERKG